MVFREALRKPEQFVIFALFRQKESLWEVIGKLQLDLSLDWTHWSAAVRIAVNQ